MFFKFEWIIPITAYTSILFAIITRPSVIIGHRIAQFFCIISYSGFFAFFAILPFGIVSSFAQRLKIR